MKPSISISKITPPYLSKVLFRPRLLDLLEKNRDKKLILILGQAAQGKSTLAASYVKVSKTPFAWINLDKEDSDPVNLFRSIVHAFQYALVDIDLLPLLSYPSINTGAREEIPLYREWTNALAEHIPSSIHCVLDGLDRLAYNSPAYRFLQVFVENYPLHAQLFLLSREMPPPTFEFQNLKIRQAAFILKNEDIAFTQEEIKEFFHNHRNIYFDSDQLKKIYSATKGWVGGLILLSESLSRFPEPLRKSFVARDLPDHFKNEVFQYFGKEIFDSQPREVQDFLLKSSLIDLIEPVFIKEFTGMDNAEDVLRDHVRKNLFVQSFYDEKKGWLFKYHQLFRDVLKAKFKTNVGEEEKTSLFFKAATLYEKRNELEDAIKYFLEARAYANAASLIERIGLDLFKVGRIGDLSQWIQTLPEDIVQGNPWLLFYLSMTNRFKGTEENILNLQKAVALFDKGGEVRGHLLSLGSLIETSIVRGHDLIPLAALIDQAEKLLQSSETDPYPYERAFLFLQTGLGLTVRGGNPRKGFWACQNAYLISRELSDVPLQVNALVNAVQALCWNGEFALADEKSQELSKLVAKHHNPVMRIWYQLARCEFSFFKGDFNEARNLIHITKNEAEKQGLIYLFPVTMVYDLLLQPHFQQYREAEKIGANLLNFSTSIGNSFMFGLALLYLGRNSYYEGNYEKARDFLNRSHQVLSSEEVRAEYHLHLITILNGFISCHLQQHGNVEKNLRNTLDYFNSLSSFIVVDTHFSMALLKYSQANTDESIAHLGAGLKISREKGYYNFPLTSPRDLLKICILALELEVKGGIDYAAYLLTTRLTSLADPELKKFAHHPSAKIREKAWEIRKKIHLSKAPRLRIETLGGLKIYRGDSLIEEKEWDRKQPKQLLMTLLAHRGNRASKEILIDDFWPDEKPGTAEKNFKTTLQRLRKSLESVLHRDFGSSYIHLYDGNVFLDPELCEVDVDQFSSLITKAKAEEKRRETKAALLGYQAAADLYKGDFLTEEIQLSVVDMKREEVRQKYIDILIKMGQLHEKQGASRKAIECHKKAIQTDPLLEETYQRLMTLYSSKRMYNEALKTYEACKKALKAGLKTDPDSTTNALYKKVIENVNKGIPPQ